MGERVPGHLPRTAAVVFGRSWPVQRLELLAIDHHHVQRGGEQYVVESVLLWLGRWRIERRRERRRRRQRLLKSAAPAFTARATCRRLPASLSVPHPPAAT